MTHSPILTVTLNPALDLSASAPAVTPGPKLRCTAPRTDPGGGGINVSRVITELGGSSRALVALGGPTGARLGHLLAHAGIDTITIPVDGDTRESLSVTDEATGGQYRFVLPGPQWDVAEAEGALATLAQAVTPGALVVLSGSLPPGLTPDYQDRLIATVTGAGGKLLADTSGAALTHLAEGTGLWVLRMDQHEAEELVGLPLPERSHSAGFAADLVAHGAARAVIIARGADGAVLATADTQLHVAAAQVPVLSKVGAGDSFMGALTLALARGADWAEALQWGSAAASAAVMTEATELCHLADVKRLLPRSPVSEL
ncbi:1-phosphofructokinase family hexose kinase [Actibacterium sp. XHP0104]|uniref:1-phosphofructokinase family hexose kinase n=1 Tax=Actibacterium sp. XHP0104 TaxID=2984335 RepID=UPI0021E95D9A|nr:1-phosphofructokinase family hexose kinase [Actibacterium sp. XHP0104]MCV2880442.1 1-phosphofructokinase family hexose kinase [Actibacterium sp. XHP0104]